MYCQEEGLKQRTEKCVGGQSINDWFLISLVISGWLLGRMVIGDWSLETKVISDWLLGTLMIRY